MKIKFLVKCSYPQNDPKQSREYAAGETYDVSDDHAMRWIRRRAAVEVVTEPEPKPEPKRAKGVVDTTYLVPTTKTEKL